MKIKHIFIVVLTAASIAVSLYADNRQASEEVQTGYELAKEKKYNNAANAFLNAALYADDTFIKANALKKAAFYFRKANLLYKEFDCLEKLINGFPNYVKIDELVNREFEIGDEYFQGYREPAFTWFPWIKGEDKTVKIYETALKHGPFASHAAQTKLRLARIYIQNADTIDKGIKTLREVCKLYPGTNAQKYAYLELANALMQLAESGDGDGKYYAEAKDVFLTIFKKYSDDKEILWAKEAYEKLDGYAARRFYGLAEFYHRQGDDETAKRYLAQIIRKYPDSSVTFRSEQLLSEIDKDFKPSASETWKAAHARKYKIVPLPKEKEEIICIPENSNGKWLLPVYNLKSGEKKEKKQKLLPEIPDKNDKLY